VKLALSSLKGYEELVESVNKKFDRMSVKTIFDQDPDQEYTFEHKKQEASQIMFDEFKKTSKDMFEGSRSALLANRMILPRKILRDFLKVRSLYKRRICFIPKSCLSFLNQMNLEHPELSIGKVYKDCVFGDNSKVAVRLEPFYADRSQSDQQCQYCSLNHPYVAVLDGEMAQDEDLLLDDTPNVHRLSEADCIVLWKVLKKRNIQKVIRENTGPAVWKRVLGEIAKRHHELMKNKNFSAGLQVEKARVTFRMIKELRERQQTDSSTFMTFVILGEERVQANNLELMVLSDILSRMFMQHMMKERVKKDRERLLLEVNQEVKKSSRMNQADTLRMQKIFDDLSKAQLRTDFTHITRTHGQIDIPARDRPKADVGNKVVYKSKGQVKTLSYTEAVHQWFLQAMDFDSISELKCISLWCISGCCCFASDVRKNFSFLESVRLVFTTTANPAVVRMDIVADRTFDDHGSSATLHLLHRQDWDLNELDDTSEDTISITYDPRGDAVDIKDSLTFIFRVQYLLLFLLRFPRPQQDINFESQVDASFLKH
jgi:hypothetical protein